MPPSTLHFITGNANKLAEVKTILGDTVHLTSKSLDLVEIQGTIEDISTDKCKRATGVVRAFPFTRFLGTESSEVEFLFMILSFYRLEDQCWWRIHVYLSTR